MRWTQQRGVLVDNKPGGNSIVGAVEAARGAPDGYTLFIPNGTTMTANKAMYSTLPYDPVRDFTPICMLAGIPLVVMSSEVGTQKTLVEYISEVQKKPESVTFGSAAGAQIQVEQWMKDWGVKFRYVMYKSGIDVTKALLSGEIQLGVDAISNNLQHLKSGKARGVAVNASTRMPMLPDVPTMNEQGIKHTEPQIWNALVAPAGLPTALQAKIYADVQTVLAMPEVSDKLVKELGLELLPGVGPDELMRRVRAETAVVTPLVKELGLQVN
jgi:tripartite-type tricarboxylate transporter receptor subunit TctC